MSLTEGFSVSVRGAGHIRNGLPMQDKSYAYYDDNMSVAVVSDGHGAAKHFRSEVGSAKAVEVTSKKLAEFFSLNPTYEVFCTDTQAKLERLKCAILCAWQNELQRYTEAHPFTEEELTTKASPRFVDNKDYDVLQPYGATLLAALVSKEYYLLLMIGDGAIVKLTPNTSEMVTFEGKTVYDDQPHSATDSMCGQNAFETMFFSYGKTCDNVAFGLCSDGLSETFVDDSYLYKVMQNYLNFYAEEGLEKTREAVANQLNTISAKSIAKDDISVAFATLSLSAYDKRATDDTANDTAD